MAMIEDKDAASAGIKAAKNVPAEQVEAAILYTEAYLKTLRGQPLDDSEPVTPEWLWSYENTYAIPGPPRRGLARTAQFSFTRDGAFCCVENYTGDGIDIPLQTRGDVRKLCEVLNIELKEKRWFSSNLPQTDSGRPGAKQPLSH